jgi:hypothetical protein
VSNLEVDKYGYDAHGQGLVFTISKVRRLEMPQVFSKYVPWHKRIVNDASRQQRRQEIEVKYHAADDKLRLLENELDALIHFVMSSLVILVDYNPFHISQSKILRQEQMEVMQNVVTYSDATPSTRTVIPDANERLGHYLQLQERRNLVDQAVSDSFCFFAHTSSHFTV